MTKTRILWWVCALALSTTVLAACGGDDEDGSTPDAAGDGDGDGDGGGDGDGDGDASTGTGGMGGSGGTGGTTPVTPPVECGTASCAQPADPTMGMGAALGFAPPMACCVDEDEGTCGLTMAAGGTCNPPAVDDPRCPDTDLGGLGAIAGGAAMGGYGCCIDNQCGVDASAFGGGCTENSAAKTQVEALPLIGALIAAGIPDPQACDEGGDAGGDDAGH